MTLNEQLIEIRQQFAYIRRQPESRVVIGLILFFVATIVLTRMVLPLAFPAKAAELAVLDSTFEKFNLFTPTESKFPCSAHGVHLFGYKFSAGFTDNNKTRYSTDGTACWDVFKKRWEWVFHSKEYAQFNSDASISPK